MDPIANDIDVEKATGTSGEPPYSPNSQLTWESQNGTLNPPPEAERIVIEEDTDEENGRFRRPV
jgi:hypothetical protein